MSAQSVALKKSPKLSEGEIIRDCSAIFRAFFKLFDNTQTVLRDVLHSAVKLQLTSIAGMSQNTYFDI